MLSLVVYPHFSGAANDWSQQRKLTVTPHREAQTHLIFAWGAFVHCAICSSGAIFIRLKGSVLKENRCAAACASRDGHSMAIAWVIWRTKRHED